MRKLHLRRKYTLILIGAILIPLSMYAFRVGPFAKEEKQPEKNIVKTEAGGQMDLSPASPTERAEVDRHKDEIVSQQTSTESSGASNVTIKPVITYAGKDGVNAYVPGILEDGGVCTLVLSQGNQKVEKSSKGFKDARYTSCTPFNDLPFPSGSNGQWEAIVIYKSANHQGESQTEIINVD